MKEMPAFNIMWSIVTSKFPKNCQLTFTSSKWTIETLEYISNLCKPF